MINLNLHPRASGRALQKGINICLLFVLSLGLLSTSFSIFFSDNAGAVSPQDDYYNVTETLWLKNVVDGCTADKLDVSLDWSEVLFDANAWNWYSGERQFYKDKFDETISSPNGSWAVVGLVGAVDDSNADMQVRVIYSPTGLDGTFDDINKAVKVSGKLGQDYYVLDLQVSPNNSCNTFIGGRQTNTGDGNFYWDISTQSKWQINYLAVRIDIDMPAGYNGRVFRESATSKEPIFPQVTYVVKKLNLRMIYLRNFKDIEHKISWKVLDTDGSTVMEEKTLDKLEVFEYDFKSLGDYTVKVKIAPAGVPYPPLPVDEYEFIESTIVVKIDGSDYTSSNNPNREECNEDAQCTAPSVFRECFKDELPFIDVPNCWYNVGAVIELMSFGSIRFGNEWTHSTGCKNLVVFDDWLNLENNTVCPYFSSEVRNIVTPFVTFILGLLTIKFITSNKEGST